MSNARWLPPVRDGELAKFVKVLQKKFPSVSATANIPGLQINLLNENSEELKALTSANGFAISSMSCQLSGAYFHYSNQHGQQTPFSKLEVNVNQNVATHPDQTKFVIEVSRFFAPTSSATMPADTELQAQRISQVETFLGGAVERFEELQASFARKNQELREQQQAQVEEIRSQQAKELEVHLEAVSKKELELQEARKLLDDRSNTHARRDIRKDIKSEITAALDAENSSKNVEAKRWWLRISYLTVVVLVAALASYSLYTFNLSIVQTDAQFIWLSGIKATVASVSFVAVALLYLKWENSWLSQQSRFELTLAATKVDIDRASWIAESLLEWNRESPNNPIPAELLSSFSRRLFDWESKVEDHHTASDSLASAILGSAARLQIGPSGANVEIDRKGLNALKKD